MARKEVTAQLLCRRLGWGESTLGRRLRAERPFPAEELVSLCQALNADPIQLIGRAVDRSRVVTAA